jgi:hypothetical protein
MAEHLPMDARYIITVQSSSPSAEGNFFQAWPGDGREELADYIDSGVDPRSDVDPRSGSPNFPAGVDAIYWGDYGFNAKLILRPAEKDWVFLAYKGDLVSDADARRQNIRYPHPADRPSEANASVQFMTGPCIRETRT